MGDTRGGGYEAREEGRDEEGGGIRGGTPTFQSGST
jgi:hypothetical protein